MVYTIKNKKNGKYLTMNEYSFELQWGKKEESMIFRSELHADVYAFDNLSEASDEIDIVDICLNN